MGMPVPCDKCGEWVELDSTRKSNFNKTEMLCQECHSTEFLVYEKVQEINYIQYLLDSRDELVKGDRRGWKKNIKDLHIEIKTLGYVYDGVDCYCLYYNTKKTASK